MSLDSFCPEVKQNTGCVKRAEQGARRRYKPRRSARLFEETVGPVTKLRQDLLQERLRPKPSVPSNMIHEGQHSIQHRTSGFEGGASPDELTPARIGSVKDPQTGKNLKPKEIYMRVLGEAEARLADTRKDFTDKERAERFPWTMEGGLDRREDDLILRKDLKKNQVGDIFSLNNAPTSKMPELQIDNPGGKWLEGKLQQAADDRRIGKSGLAGAANITGSFKEPLNLPPGLLKDIPGNLGEEALRNTGSKLVALKNPYVRKAINRLPFLFM